VPSIHLLDESANPTGYEGVNALAAKLGRPPSTLIALSRGNDPFFAGRPARRADGEWFGEIFERFGFSDGVHLRRIHYRLISSAAPVRMRDGKPYTNTERCWGRLISASQSARYLRLVDHASFIDRRNAAPVLAGIVEDEDAAIGLNEEADYIWPGPRIEMLDGNLPSLPRLSLAPPTVGQRYVVEIWCEKSTIDDLLMPLHRRYGLNIVTLTGESSDIRCQELVDRTIEHGKPVRVLYISDFDPGGRSMPVAAARKIEYRLRADGLDLDIQVRPVLLTYEQCVHYRLPRTPIKKTERRAGHFEQQFGSGATEIDALAALHPGEIEHILQQEIERYYDADLDDRVEELAGEIDEELDEINSAARSETEIETLEREYAALVKRINAELRPIAKRYRGELQGIADRHNAIRDSVAQRLNEEAPDLDGYEWPEPDDADEDDDPLFDSRRGYVKQIDKYKVYQGKPSTGRRPGGRK
jgi:hypothetical protein